MEYKQFLMMFAGAVGALWVKFCGDMPDAFYWLLAFVLVDYITGMTAAFITKSWSSKTGFKGILKKSVILSIVILFHGLSNMINIAAIDTAIIFAFAVNEMCSILENIERAGLGSIIPAPVRKVLQIVENKENDVIEKLK